MSEPAGISSPESGRLVLVATPIGNLSDLSERAISVLASADVICCEDTRHTGRLFERARITPKRLISLNSHNESQRLRSLLADLASGKTVALVADAGTPLVSDPGSRIVAAALAAGHAVTVVPGPSAVLAALVLSGFDVSRFRFEGFLARSGGERRERLEEIAAARSPTVVFEAPNRVSQTLRDLAAVAGGERRVAIARELTKLHEEVWHGSLDEALERSTPERRGEHVLVVDAAPLATPPGRSAARLAIESLLTAGLDAKDATRAVEILLGVPHRVAYQAGLEVRAAQGERAAPTGRAPRKTTRRRPVR